jgi:hypothetical protein
MRSWPRRIGLCPFSTVSGRSVCGQNGMGCASSAGLTMRISQSSDSKIVAVMLPTIIRCHRLCEEAPITTTSAQDFATRCDRQASAYPSRHEDAPVPRRKDAPTALFGSI